MWLGQLAQFRVKPTAALSGTKGHDERELRNQHPSEGRDLLVLVLEAAKGIGNLNTGRYIISANGWLSYYPCGRGEGLCNYFVALWRDEGETLVTACT